MKKEPPKKYSAKEAAALCGCTGRAARKWAAANGVAFTGEGYRKDYHFTEAGIERFRERPRPGRRRHKDTEK